MIHLKMAISSSITVKSRVIGISIPRTAHNVKKICMPQIGCGLDNLKWSWVKMRIEQVFESTDMCIDVYCKKRTSYWAVNMLCCK